MKKLLPDPAEYQAAMAQYSRYSNKEGMYGDADIMSLTHEDSDNIIPTYQFWAAYG